MSIAAIYTCRDEADIIELSFRHILSEGIEHIFTTDHMSTDGTREIIDRLVVETGQITVIDDTEEYYQQVKWINHLAEMAGLAGHEWVLSLDIDEFPYALDGRTIVEATDEIPPEYNKIFLRTYRHHDWDSREVEPKRLPKCAIRWRPGASLTIGSHEASPEPGISDVLAIREWQYRDFQHYCRKARASCATLPPDVRAQGGAWHHLILENKSDEELNVEWQILMNRPTVADPIPSHVRHGCDPVGMA